MVCVVTLLVGELFKVGRVLVLFVFQITRFMFEKWFYFSVSIYYFIPKVVIRSYKVRRNHKKWFHDPLNVIQLKVVVVVCSARFKIILFDRCVKEFSNFLRVVP